MSSSSSSATAKAKYGASGHSFPSSFQAFGPAAALGRLRLSVSMYSILYGSAVFAAGYFLTTDRVVMSSDMDPIERKLREFPVTTLLVRHNRITGSTSVEAPLPDPVTGKHITYRSHVNRILYSYDAYHNLRRETVAVPLADALDPARFVKAELVRSNQRLGSGVSGGRIRGNNAHLVSSTTHSAGSTSSSSSGVEPKLFVTFRARAKAEHGAEYGHATQLEYAMETAAAHIIKEWYQHWITQVKYGEEARSKPKAIVEQLLHSGMWNGEGVTAEGVLLSGSGCATLKEALAQFSQKVSAHVDVKMGRNVRIDEVEVRLS